MFASKAKNISVVMATYNGARYIDLQIRSVLGQTVLPAELIVADDGSTDGTPDIVRSLTAGCGVDVRLIRNERRLGFRENFLQNALLATGDIIAFCDQDDIWNPTKLERCAERFDAAGNVALVVHTAALIDASTEPIGSFRQGIKADSVKPPLSYDPWNTFWGFSMVFRRDLLHLVDIADRFVDFIDPREKIAHDRWIMFLGQMVGSIAEIDEPLVQYRQHDGNAFGHHKKMAVDIRRRSEVYIAATRQMIDIVARLPEAATTAQFPQFNRERCLAYLDKALAQLMKRDGIYNAVSRLDAARNLADCIGGGYYRGVHDGRMRWASLARDMQMTIRRPHAAGATG